MKDSKKVCYNCKHLSETLRSYICKLKSNELPYSNEVADFWTCDKWEPTVGDV